MEQPHSEEPPSLPRVFLIAALTAYFLFRWLLGTVRLPADTPGPALLGVQLLVATGAIGLPVVLLAALAGRPSPVRTALLALAAGLALWLGPLFVPAPRAAAALEALSDLGKILAAGGAGVGMAALLREPNILLPAGLFAAFADVVVVSVGTVRHALSTSQGQALVAAVSARVPSVHPALGTGVTIGPADFLFLGVFLGCVWRFRLGLARNGVVLTAALAGTLLLTNVVPAVPALAPMAVAFLAVNYRAFRLTRSELASTGVVLVTAGALFLGYFLFLFPRR